VNSIASVRLAIIFVISTVTGSFVLAQAWPADISGDWQVAWQGRLGTQRCLVHLERDGKALKGIFHDPRGAAQLSGTVDENRITFDVQFQGKRPFTTRFTGVIKEGKIEGTSQATGVGSSGAYLGHGGEIVQPEHPWTATRVADTQAQSRP
jgi:hypothetical protein